MANDKIRRELLAKNTSAPLSQLRKLLEDREVSVRAALAENRNACMEMLFGLAKDPSPIVRMGVACNDVCPSKLIKLLSGDESKLVRAMANARDIQASATQLRELAEHRSVKVRAAVARHFKTPHIPLLLMKLLDDKASVVRNIAIARDKTSDQYKLSALIANPDWIVRALVAIHPNSTISMLEILAFDEDFVVRDHVARNPLTTSDLIRKMFKESDLWYSIARNPNTPVALLQKLINNKSKRKFKDAQKLLRDSALSNLRARQQDKSSQP